MFKRFSWDTCRSTTTTTAAKAWVYGKLFVALLAEKLIHHAARAISPWGYDVPAPVPPQPVARLQVRAQPSRPHQRTAAPADPPDQGLLPSPRMSPR